MATYGHITYKTKEIPTKKKNDSLSFRLSKPSFLNTSINSKLYKDITKKLATKTTHKKEPTQIHTSSSPPPKILLNQSYKTTYNKKKLQQHNQTTNPITIRKKIRSISMNAPKMNIQTYPNTTSYRENKEHKKGTYNNNSNTNNINNKMKHKQCKLYKQISVVKSSSLHINKPTLPQKRSNSVQKGSYSLLQPNKERSASVKIKNSKRICVLNINNDNNNNKYINLSDRHNNSESKHNGYIRDSYINMIKNIKPKKHSNSLINSLNSTPNQINIKHDKSLPQSKKFFDKINTDDNNNNNKINISNDSIKRKRHKSSAMKYQKISTQIKIVPFRTKQGFDNEIRLKKPRTKSVFTSRSYTLNKETNNNNNINTYKEHSTTLPKIIKLESKCNPGISLKKKKVNQDMFFIHENIFDHTDNYIIGVCDGHGPFGHLCSEYIANIFNTRFQSTYKSSYISKTLPQIISSTFSSITHSLLAVQTIDTLISGSTLDVVFILQNKLICANVGDSRCVLGIESGNDINNKYTYIELSKDHHPDDPKEQERIVKKGGTIKQRYDKLLKKYIGPKRVYVKNMDVPGLAMTRSVGDEIGRGVGIISEPDIKEYELKGNERFVVLASDGIWEFISSKEVVDLVGRYYDGKDIKGAVDGLIEMACQRWKKKDNYVDDITVIIGFFG